MALKFILNSSMLSGCSEFPNNHSFIQFSFFEDMLYMLTNC